MNDYGMRDYLDRFYNERTQVIKADAPVLTNSSGFYQALYGPQLFVNVSTQLNAWGALPKVPYTKSGFRLVSALGGSAADGRISEGGNAPETAQPTIVTMKAVVGEVAHDFAVSWRASDLAGKDDTVTDMGIQRNICATRHKLRLNQQILADADTPVVNGFESIDRITMSDAAATACLSAAADIDLYYDNSTDGYSVDRSSSTVFDAVVSHGSTTDRTLAMNLIEDTLGSLGANGAKTNVIITGHDTKWRIISLMQSQVRYSGLLRQDAGYSVGINGIQTDSGAGFGVRVAEIFGIPLIADDNVPKDTISRIYLLDTTEDEMNNVPKIGIHVLRPTVYYESTANNPLQLGKFETEGGFYTSGQLICTTFFHQASIRDLK